MECHGLLQNPQPEPGTLLQLSGAGFFYQSSQHLGCLQKLELAIRLHRGLNVVMGNVGTGKTTLCRELLIRFAQSEEDRNEVEIHLLLDPAIGTPREFLAAVATAFGISAEIGTAESEWQLKEGIKHYLFQKGVDEKKTVVLIIDEGQKLPDFGLEILREFLNYETNEAKLLQIVIFAQNEFEEMLQGASQFRRPRQPVHRPETPEFPGNATDDRLPHRPGQPAKSRPAFSPGPASGPSTGPRAATQGRSSRCAIRSC